MLAVFGSVLNAVRCAVQIQTELKAANSELPENQKMEFRIGINLGDIIEDVGTIHGNGVNIAARIESLADPGGVSISRNVPVEVPIVGDARQVMEQLLPLLEAPKIDEWLDQITAWREEHPLEVRSGPDNPSGHCNGNSQP